MGSNSFVVMSVGLVIVLLSVGIARSNPRYPPNDIPRYQENLGGYNDPLKQSYGSQTCQRPLDPITATQRCFGQQPDICSYYYTNAVCDYTDQTCKCRCGYRWDYSTKQCLLDPEYESCWFCSRRNVTLPLMIAILVIVIIIAVFTIPTCVAVTCFKSKS